MFLSFLRRPTSFRQDRRGSAIVEFALVSPAVILIIIVLVEIGWYMWTRNVIDHAARETVRYAVVRGPWGDKWAGTAAAAQTAIDTYAATKVTEGGLDSSKATTSSVMDTAARTVSVSVTYQYAPMLVPTTAIPAATLTATSELDIQRP